MDGRLDGRKEAWIDGWRQHGSVVRVGDLNVDDLGTEYEFVLGDPRGKFITLCK